MTGGKRNILAAFAAGAVAAVSGLGTFVPVAASGTLSVIDYSQCANGAPGTTTTPPNGCVSWINGDLNAQNSQYHEDQVVPQRLELSLGKTNTASDHTITLQYLDRKGSANAHAYDSLATWNFTVSAAARCQGLSASACPGGTASTIPIPLDPTTVPPIGAGGNGSAVVSAHQLPNQVFVMYGGSLTSVSAYTHTAAASAGTDDNVNVTIHYSAAAGATVQLLFGGHLGAESGPRGWGTGLGAASINGGPYHISLVMADGVSIGSKDNNIQSSAILGQASLSITKTADSSTVNAGGQIGFTITVTNNGGAPASGVTVTDNLPNTGSAWTMSPTVSGCTISGATATQVLNCTLTVAANSAVSIHVISIAANPAACGTLSNTATFSGGGSSGSAGPVSVTVTCPALKVVKTPDAASVSSGQSIGFTITVTNTGNGTATGVTLNDPLPGGTGINWSINTQPAQGSCSIGGSPPSQTLTCSLGNLAAGASLSVHIISATTSGTSGTFTNTATAQATNSPPASGTGSETVNPPSLHVTKTPDATSVSSGSPIGFTITVTNSGTGTALGATLTDPLPVGTGLNWSISPAYTGPGTCSISGTAPAQQTLNCSFGNLAPGASVSVHVSSPTTAQTSGTFTNTATAQATNNPPTTGTGSTTVNQPGLKVTKTPDATSVSSGSPIGFTITVTNTGTGTATGVTLTDPLPLGTGLNWSINPAYTGPGTCSISGTAPAQQTLNCSFGNLAPGASVSVHVSSPTTAQTSGTFTNTATAQATNNPPTTGTGTEIVNQPSLSVTKTPDATSVSSGSPIGFTITVTNSGPGTATAVTLNDPLPVAPGLNWSINPAYTGPGTCSISGTAPAQQTLTCAFGDLGPGASVSVHVVSPTTAQTSGVISNTAVAQGTNTPPTSGTGSTTVNQPSLHISKTPDQSSVSAGQTIGFTVTVSNSGPGTATNVVVTDTLPNNPGLTWSVASITPAPTPPDGCSISTANPQVLTCTFASLAPGASFAIDVTSPTTSATCGTVSNSASVQASNGTAIVTSQTVSVTVNCPDVHIAKTADSGTVNAGQQVGFTITVTNMGAGTATNVTVTDTLPNAAGLSWSIASVTPALTPPDSCSISTANPQVLTCTFASLAPGASEAIHIVSPTTAQTCGTISNTASETTGNDGSATTPAPVTITINCAVLNVTKTACPQANVPVGGLLTYTITFSNTGTAPATSVVLVDTLPAGVSVVNSGGGTVGNGTVTWNIGTLAAGASGSETLVVLVTAADGTTLVNTVTLSSPDAVAVATSSTSTLVSNAGAITHGSAFGLDVNALGTEIISQFGKVSTVAPGTPQTAADQLAVVPIPGVVTVTLVRQESNSAVTDHAESTATSTVVGLNLLSGAITADAVAGVSQSVASSTTATFDSTGANFVNLVVQGAKGPVALANVAPNTSVTVYNPLAPAQKLASVMLYEESGTSGLSGNLWHASHTLNMIDVTLLEPFGGLPLGARIIVAHAQSDATYPSGLACGTQPNTVSGKAFTVFANGTVGNTTVVNAQVGDAELPPTGGSNSDTIAFANIPGIVTTATATNSTSGATSPSPNAVSASVVHSTNILGGLITADLIDVKASSSATGSHASTTFGSTCGVDACASGCSSSSPCFVNLAVNGTSIVGINGGTVTPNTTIAIPQPDGSLVLVILNEQTASSDGSHNTSGTVNAIDVFVLNNSGIVTVHVIVASAHSDAHHS